GIMKRQVSFSKLDKTDGWVTVWRNAPVFRNLQCFGLSEALVRHLWVLLLLAALMPAVSAYGQETTVKGQVFDQQTEEEMPGVNVMVKGTTVGTSTDTEGSYELTVPSLQDTLVFSFVGYRTTEVPI